MTALIIAPGLNPDMAALNERYPSPLLPLVDRPFIQHVVEFLVDQGITRFEFILSHLPEKIEALLGDGHRWGSAFRFHLARDPFSPYNSLKNIKLDKDCETLLLVHADRLPQIDLAETRPASQTAEPKLFFWSDRSVSEAKEERLWTGWAWVPKNFLKGLPKNLDEEGFKSHLMSLSSDGELSVKVPKPLNVRSYNDLLTSHRAVLDKNPPGLFLAGKEAEEAIWLSRNISLHPTAKLTPPVYINEDCQIDRGVQLGPHVVIGRGSVIEAKCTVENTVVFPGSYVGQGLELADVIVDKNRLINVRYGAAVTFSEDFILGDISESQIGKHLSGIFSRIVAAGLLVFLWPFLLIAGLFFKLFRKGPVFFKKKGVRLPTESDDTEWRFFNLLSFVSDVQKNPLAHLFFQLIPAMVNIVKGDLRFVGVSPRSREEIQGLSSDWRALYLSAKPGIITEAYVNYGAAPTEDERYSAEAFYSAVAGTGHDFKLLVRYLGCVLKSLC